jgi:hypothetical protein
MFNRQRTAISNGFLNLISYASYLIIMTSLACTRKLLEDLKTDITNPVEIFEKINHLKVPEYLAHFWLAVALILRGNWVLGMANFPFLFFHCTQLFGGSRVLDYKSIFTILHTEKMVTRSKYVFFFLEWTYIFLEWATWVPPRYMPMGYGYNVMVNIQVVSTRFELVLVDSESTVLPITP